MSTRGRSWVALGSGVVFSLMGPLWVARSLTGDVEGNAIRWVFLGGGVVMSAVGVFWFVTAYRLWRQGNQGNQAESGVAGDGAAGG
jgi:hypothetical protein